MALGRGMALERALGLGAVAGLERGLGRRHRDYRCHPRLRRRLLRRCRACRLAGLGDLVPAAEAGAQGTGRERRCRRCRGEVSEGRFGLVSRLVLGRRFGRLSLRRSGLGRAVFDLGGLGEGRRGGCRGLAGLVSSLGARRGVLATDVARALWANQVWLTGRDAGACGPVRSTRSAQRWPRSRAG